MRRILFAATAPLILSLAASPAAAAEGAWRVSEASGDVRLVENGRSRAAVRGALLASGSVIATGAGGRAVIVRGREFVVVSQRSQLRVPAAAESRGGLMQMITDFGTALFRIEKKSTPHFGVKTPYLAAVVKGTTFTVTVGPEGGSVQVTEGAVEVSTLDGGAAELVRPGDIAVIAASDLYRLSIEGQTSRVVRSPAGGTVTSSAKPAAAYAGPPAGSAVIAAAVGEDSRSLSDMTRGLIDGASRADVVLAELNTEARSTARKDDEEAANGGGNGKPGEDKGGGKDDKDDDKADAGKGDKADAGENDKDDKTDDGKDDKGDGGTDGKTDDGKDDKGDGGTDGKTDDGKDDKTDEDTDGKTEDGKDDKTDDGTDGKTDGKDDKTDDGADGKTDDGKDDKTDDGTDGKTDDGKDDKTDDGTDGTTDDGKDDKTDDGTDGTTDDGKDDKTDDGVTESEDDLKDEGSDDDLRDDDASDDDSDGDTKSDDDDDGDDDDGKKDK